MGTPGPGPAAAAAPPPDHAGWRLRAAAVGVAAGLLSGLFGVGGGIVMVPLLVALLALDQRRASATSLLAIVPIAAASAVGYGVNGNIDLGAGVLLLLGGLLGAQVGARLLPRTPIATLQLWFGVLSLVTAARLLVESPAEGGGLGQPWEAVLLLLVGMGAGVLAGLLGVGGGIIMVPGLVIVAGDDADVARGTSLLVIVATALAATVTNLRNGLVVVRPALVAGLAGVPAGLAGAALGQWLPQRAALALFAVLLAWSGVRVLRQGLAGRRAARAASP
jgi:uncharacterized protein